MRIPALMLLLPLLLTIGWSQESNTSKDPLRLGVVGMTHGHVHQILRRGKVGGDIQIVGFVEPNRDLAERLTKQYGYASNLIYPTLEAMVEKTKPEAVSAFNSTYEHLETVRYCAPKGIHIMVEKPLAVNWNHAQEMIALAKKHHVQLLTNYETSWYGSNAKAYEMVHTDQIGAIRRIVFHTGHPGPIEIGCNPEFLEWLTDPVRNGGGALTDFGCYGANLTTWFMQGKKPESVTCVTQQLKPDKYPKVDDDATIILKYPQAEVIIQASWNWPHNVKDMELDGTTGYVLCKNGTQMQVLENEKEGPKGMEAESLPENSAGPFTLLRRIIKEGHTLDAFDVTSLENNEIVMQILDAARQSSEQNRTIFWHELYSTE